MNRKSWIPILAVISAFGIGAPLRAQPDGMMHPSDVIRVTGTSTVRVKPDRVTFSLGVQTSAPTAQDAVKANNSATASVIAALKKAGASSEQIQTSNFSIYPQQDYSDQRRPRVIGYQVNNSVNVSRDRIDDAGTLLQAAIDAGANTASGINFVVSDWKAAELKGLSDAFTNARAKAAALASAAGRSLGQVIGVMEGVESGPPTPRPQAMLMEAKVASSQVPVESGTDERTFVITAVFALK